MIPGEFARLPRRCGACSPLTNCSRMPILRRRHAGRTQMTCRRLMVAIAAIATVLVLSRPMRMRVPGAASPGQSWHAHVLRAARNKYGTQCREPDPAQHDPARKRRRDRSGITARFVRRWSIWRTCCWLSRCRSLRASVWAWFLWRHGGFASLLGLMLQVGLVVIVARLLFAWWQRRHEPAYCCCASGNRPRL